MPDGTLVKNVPDDVTQEELLDRFSSYKQQTETQRPGWSDLPKNVIPSAGQFFSGIAETIAHPVDTLNNLQRVVSGGYQNLPSSLQPVSPENIQGIQQRFGLPSPMRSEDKQIGSAVGEFYKNRYGSLENLRNTIIQDPVGFSADVSAVAGLSGAGLRAGGLAKAADVAQTVSNYTNPIYLAGKGATAIAKPVYKAIVGKTSGVGPQVIEEQLRGSPEFQSAMDSVGNKVKRAVGAGGEFTPESKIVENTRDSLEVIKEQRRVAYQSKLENLKNASQEIPIDDIKNLADEQLTRFNVKKSPTGELDFSRSTASGASANEIKQVYEMVQDWGSKPGDTTPAMLDVLKRRLDDVYSEGRTSRAMVTALKKSVQEKLVNAVPEYAEMTKDYAKTTDLIKNMERALGAGDRTSADTAIRRLTMALREDKSLRRDLLTTLDQAGQKNVAGSVAGALSRPWVTKSLESSLAAGSIGAAAYLSSPTLAALIPLASPRVVGELNVVLGKVGRAAPYGKGTGILAYQTGRIPLEQPQ